MTSAQTTANPVSHSPASQTVESQTVESQTGGRGPALAAAGTPVAAQLRRVLIANRGEIAVRVVQACRTVGLETVVVTSEVDRDGMAATLADRAVCIGGAAASASYLNADAVLAAAVGTGCDAVHPGYGFLSENPGVRPALRIGGTHLHRSEPPHRGRHRRQGRGPADCPGRWGSDSSRVQTSPIARTKRSRRPRRSVIPSSSRRLPAVAAGACRWLPTKPRLRKRLPTAVAEATAAFGDGRIYVEKFIARAHHIEVQVIGDKHGSVVHVGERDCSAQRRHQKVIEESPAPGLAEETRSAIHRAAVRFAEAIELDSAGTVEFVYDADTAEFAFLEFNARIQVEHPVSELVAGIDLVAEQIRAAAGLPLSFRQDDVRARGHAIEARIMAESPERGFIPMPGTVTGWAPPSGIGIRVDSHCRPGAVISPYYDSMIAKVIAHGPDRETAAERLSAALAELRVEGVPTTAGFSKFLLKHQVFQGAEVTTRWIDQVGADEYRSNFEETK